MQTPGTYISGIGHIGLIIWLIAGWGFSSDPLEFDIAEVSVVSGEEYAALVAASTPNPSVAPPDAPTAPVAEVAPETPVAEAVPEPAPQPDQAVPPAQETPPPEAPAPPAPVADVADTPPEVVNPATESTPAIAEPITTDPPQARPAPRVAPEPVVQPEPEVAIADVPTPPVAPEPTPEAPVVAVPPEPAAAPDTTTEIVTEADAAPSGAIERSLRPAARPNRPAPPEPAAVAEAPAETPAEPAPATEDPAVAAALAAALATDEPAVPQGPPMTGSEREGFRIAVNSCWNVDPGSVAARVTLTVAFSLDQQGRVSGDVRQVSADGGDAAATRTAFEAARRAILRCQTQNGYDLPADKYGQWKDVEITFDPSGMRLR